MRVLCMPMRRRGTISVALFFCFLGVLVSEAVSTSQKDKDALVAFKNSLLTTTSLEVLSNWTGDPCSDAWVGVTCSELGRVTQLNLTTRGLKGPIPSALGDISELKELTLLDNELNGPIPVELGRLANLTILNLGVNNLTESIPPQLGNLPRLTFLILRQNELTGRIPLELGNLSALLRLDLRQNKLSGNIPPELTRLTSLSFLSLLTNQLEGPIPAEVGGMRNLSVLALQDNRLTGTIPSSLGNLTLLAYLNLAFNNLSGPIPPELGDCQSLAEMALSRNQLTGPIPPQLGKLSALNFLGLFANRLNGSIPAELANLSALKVLSLSNNSFTGQIPAALGSLHNLTTLELDRSALSGSIPRELSDLSQLTKLHLHRNLLSGLIPPQLGNLSSLAELNLSTNYLTGPIPRDLGRLPKLTTLVLSKNKLNGSIPLELGNVLSLAALDLSNNSLSGRIPEGLGSLTLLKEIDLSHNSLTGPIPRGFNRLSAITALDLSNNELSEPIPIELGDLSTLNVLDLSQNYLTGSIPAELGRLPSLSSLVLSDNQLTGSIPPQLGSISKLLSLSLSRNNLSGSIPAELSGLSTTVVDLSRNNLSGPIPSGVLWNPSSDLSGNFLNGSVPLTLANSSVALNCLILETGDYAKNGQRDSQACKELYPGVECRCQPPQVLGLDGLCHCVVPLHFRAVFKAQDAQSLANFTANLNNTLHQLAAVASVGDQQVALVRYSPSPSPPSVDLFFSILPLARSAFPPDQVAAIRANLGGSTNMTVPFFDPGFQLVSDVSSSDVTGVAIAVGTSLAALLLASLVTFALWRRHQLLSARRQSGSMKVPATAVKPWTLAELQKATDNFSKANSIGKGGFGEVFRGDLAGTAVAIKRLMVGGDEGWGEFEKELTTIGGIHNRNLVQLLGYCAEDGEYLLVYDFMPNGSLEDALFKRGDRAPLAWEQCKHIMIGTAQAIAYLHEGCSEKIIHRDIKPGNILIDQHYEARVCDFGLARCTPVANTHVSTGVKGTLGYLAPEYHITGQLTEKSDVYSFGMVMLVAISHCGPWSLVGHSVVGLAMRAFQLAQDGRELELLAPQFADSCDVDEARRFISVALLCIHPTWQLRPTMGRVVNMLHGNMDIPAVSMTGIDTYFSIGGLSSNSGGSKFSSIEE